MRLVARYFTSAAETAQDVLDAVKWVKRDVRITDYRTGKVTFEQRGVGFPDFWGETAVNIVTSKYFYGEMNTPERETSLATLINRVVSKYVTAGVEHGYFLEEVDVSAFRAELTYMLLHQMFAFNSPVWFNVGTPRAQQVSACYILDTNDSIPGILNWITEEGLIFKNGSGAGVNLSKLRGSNEPVNGGGRASGPVSFMRGADSVAGMVKSGGTTRRAAKMVFLDDDHPDIEEFISIKTREERKIQALRDAGFDMSVGGEDMASVQYQNANNSVMLSDAFMNAAKKGFRWDLRNRTDSSVAKTVDAAGLLRQISESAWACGDPGVGFSDTINGWNSLREIGRIVSSNPCGEYLSIPDSSCNLGSLNLMVFRSGTSFDYQGFRAAVRLAILAMDISICFADHPTDAIGYNTRRYRQLGLGYANLGALLMSLGMPYDSYGGRKVARDITEMMTLCALQMSVDISEKIGPYDGFADSKEGMLGVIKRHGGYSQDMRDEWSMLLKDASTYGIRNCQVTLLAPTGTIGLMMGCSTTGIEPAFALTTYKKTVTGDTIVTPIVEAELGARALGIPDVDPSLPVFATAVGDNAISPAGHIEMMATVQPFLSAGISKTINLPHDATVEDVEKVIIEGHTLGLKAMAIYRDGSKTSQPMSSKSDDTAEEYPTDVPGNGRRRLGKRRKGSTQSFTVAGTSGYLTTGEFDDGTLGEIFLKVSKAGSTLNGLLDAIAILTSIGLQHGVPLETIVDKLTGTKYAPAGITDDHEIRMVSSLLDYVYRRLAMDYLSSEETGVTSDETTAVISGLPHTGDADGELCTTCGGPTTRSGSCHVCTVCGTTSGCS